MVLVDSKGSQVSKEDLEVVNIMVGIMVVGPQAAALEETCES